MNRGGIGCLGLFAVLLLIGRAPLGAITCNVPGSHGTIQAAIDDQACSQIDLADQTFQESILVYRSMTIVGQQAGNSIVEGLVSVVGSATVVTVSDLQVRNGCQPEALKVAEGAELDGSRLDVVRSNALPCPVITTVFADGFEMGNTSAWSSTVPPP